MIFDDFLAHLRASGLTAPVSNAFTTEPVEDYNEEFPLVMLYPASDTFSENEANNFVIQQQTTEIVAMIGCKLVDLSVHIDEFRAAAQGWVAGAPWDALELQGGAIEGLRGEFIWWRETVTAQRSVRQSL
jgi:hypothetical protein